jgi:glutamate carboxypeptidase
MHPILAEAQKRQDSCVLLLQELVECESPSHDANAVNRFVDLFAAGVRDIASVKSTATSGFGRVLRCDFTLPGPRRRNPGIILGLGHSDTVWPLGTLRTMPWRVAEGRCWGPGVFDMKAGLAFFVTALRILRDLDIPVARKVSLLIVPDEEVGSDASRALTEKTAKEAAAVLVLEPAAGPDGKLKTARKGVGDYTIRVKGRAAHAGLDFTAGASAILELARQIDRVAGFTDLQRGITVSPGVIAGGTRRNVVAEEASVEMDMRIWKLSDAKVIDRRFRSLKPVDPRCRIEIEGGLNRPPLERRPPVVKLFRTAQAAARQLGLPPLAETSVGGGSDGNFTAGLGIPTLDGLGGIGEGAHAINESIVLEAIPRRVALLANLTAMLAAAN